MTANADRPAPSKEVISITRSKTISFSKGLSQRHEIGRWSRALIYFDPGRKRIAFRFTDDEAHPGSFALQKAASGGVSFPAHGFFRRYGIDVARHARRYEVQRQQSRALGIDEDGDSFVIQL